MKNILISFFVISFSIFASAQDNTPGNCIDKVAVEAVKAVLSKQINGKQIDRYAMKNASIDLWMVHPTYAVTFIGKVSETKEEKEFKFAAQPEMSTCTFNLVELGQ